MCRATGHGPRSPVCIYCGKSNHSSANCRYRPKDNREEPRQTPDALRTGATSENLASASRNQTGPAPHTTNNNPFSHIDGRGQNNQHYGGPQRSHHREPNGAAPRGEHTNNNQNFPPRRQQHMHTLTKDTTGDTPLPCFLHQHSTTPWPVMLWVDQ